MPGLSTRLLRSNGYDGPRYRGEGVNPGRWCVPAYQPATLPQKPSPEGGRRHSSGAVCFVRKTVLVRTKVVPAERINTKIRAEIQFISLNPEPCLSALSMLEAALLDHGPQSRQIGLDRHGSWEPQCDPVRRARGCPATDIAAALYTGFARRLWGLIVDTISRGLCQ